MVKSMSEHNAFLSLGRTAATWIQLCSCGNTIKKAYPDVNARLSNGKTTKAIEWH